MLTGFKSGIKAALLDRWKIPYSADAILPASIYAEFRNSNPITLIDIGAYEGGFTLAMKRLCGVSKGVLVEPIAALASKLRNSSDFAGLHVFECLASDCAHEREFRMYKNTQYISSTLEVDKTIAVMGRLATDEPTIEQKQARPIDDIVKDTDIEMVDLIKIDVQGLELKVLTGALRTLEQTRYLVVEVSFRPIYVGSAVFSDVYNFLMTQDYRMIGIEPGFRSELGEILQADVVFRRFSSSGPPMCSPTP